MSHNVKFLAVLLLFLLSTVLSACTQSSRSGNVYSRDQARVTHSVYYGTILRAEDVVIEGRDEGLGTMAGGAMGGVLGSTVGGGSGRAIGAVGGAILGGLAGAAAEKELTTTQGVELEVELDNGELLAIVQEKDSEYRIGDRVRVLRDAKGNARVRQ
jgi:outer membrane lipoprotein SlyB